MKESKLVPSVEIHSLGNAKGFTGFELGTEIVKCNFGSLKKERYCEVALKIVWSGAQVSYRALAISWVGGARVSHPNHLLHFAL